MGVIGSIFDPKVTVIGGSRSLENPTTSLSNPDEWLYEAFGSSKTTSGVRVNRETALTYSAVWRAVTKISSDVGKLPLFIYRRVAEGKERAAEHPAYHILRYKANSEMSALTLKQVMQAHALMGGNAYAYIDRAGDASPRELILLDPANVTPVRVNNVLWYVVKVGSEERKIRAEDILHIKGLGYDGLQGYSVIAKAAESLGMGLAARSFSSRFFANGARPGILLEAPNTLKPEARKNLVDSWNALQQGLENAHKTAVLEDGIKANPITIDAKASQLIESRQFEIREVANWFGVPPHMVGDTTRVSYNSLEQENQSYLDSALDYWLCTWEEECRDRLFTEQQKRDDSHIVEFLRQALVRANLQARGEYYTKAVGGPWMVANEARSLENMNTLEEGGQLNKAPNTPGNAEPPPAEPGPADEEEEDPADDEDEDRSVLIEAHRALLHDAFGRMVKRLGTLARKAAKKPGTFDQWLTAFPSANREVLRSALGPAVTAAEAAVRPAAPLEETRLDELVDRICTGVAGPLDALCDQVTVPQLAAAVAETTAELENSLPDEQVEFILGAGGDE